MDIEKLWGLSDEAGVAFAVAETWMVEDVDQEADVGLDALDLGFMQAADGCIDGTLEGAVVSDDLDEQAVVEWRDLRACIGVAAVETNAVTGAGTVHFDGTGVWCKVVCWVFGGDTALDGITAMGDGILGWDADLRISELVALGNTDLGLHDVDTGDLFGDAVLYLDTWVHFDEVVVALCIDEEFNGTGAAIVDVTRDLEGIFADGLTLFLGKDQGWRKFDDFLVTALDGAVTFEHVNDVAILIAKDLYFDVLWTFDVFFNEYVCDTEGFLGFAGGAVVFLFHVFFAADDAHPTTTAAGAGFEDDRIACNLGKFFCFFNIERCTFYARNGWHANFDGNFLGLDLVAECV